MKTLKKIGLIASIIGGLTLGGITPKYDSKGLESKIPTVGISVAEAKEVKAEGYEVPKIIGNSLNSKEYIEEGIKYIAELFDTADGGQTARLRVKDKIFAYDVDHDKIRPGDYTIVDTDGDGIFETKYGIQGEIYKIPEWVK